jgi:hypothetical protein
MTDLVPRPEGGREGGEGPAEGAPAAAERLKALVLDTVSSKHSRRAYKKALGDFLACLAPRPFTRASLQEFRSHMEASGLAPSSINLRLATLRKLATEAAENGWLDPTVAAGIARVRGVRTDRMARSRFPEELLPLCEHADSPAGGIGRVMIVIARL